MLPETLAKSDGRESGQEVCVECGGTYRLLDSRSTRRALRGGRGSTGEGQEDLGERGAVLDSNVFGMFEAPSRGQR